MSYDINFWRQTTSLKSSPEKIYSRLCQGKTVKGVAALPVTEILERLKQVLPGFDPTEEFPLVSLKNGSVEVSWSDQHFRFDFRGHVPAKTKSALLALMAEFQCPLYDPQLDERYDAENGTAVGKPPSNEEAATSRISVGNLVRTMARAAKVEVGPAPKALSLQPAELATFPDRAWLNDLSRQATECGYELVGDYLVPEIGVAMRVFYGAPNKFVALYEHLLGVNWAEIVIFNVDDTTENWCTWHADDVVAPWSTRVVKPGPLLDLHDAMCDRLSGKPPAKFEASDFPTIFLRECQRSIAWRQSHAT